MRVHVVTDSLIGQTISHYRILEKLGGGGMGVVYKAEDTRLHRFVALKFLPPEVARDPHALARFQREAQAASALNHPNICTIHDIGEQDGHSFIAMEFLEGVDAETSHRRSRHAAGNCCCRWPSKSLMRSMRLTPKASSIATSSPPTYSSPPAGPPRFWISAWRKSPESGTRRRGDRRDAGLPEHLTSPGSALGTVAYMSPEQVSGKELDARTDLFSFGAVLYEMATGTLPFRGDTSGLIFEAILNREPTAPVRLNPSLSPELGAHHN